MGSTRREFVKTTSAAAAALAGLAAVPASARAAVTAAGSPFLGDPNIKELAHLALDAARGAGATYADIRFTRNRTQSLFTREQRVQGLVDNETMGFGIRTLVNGAWGFAASREISRDEIARVARQSALQARANSLTVVRPVVLAPVTATPDGTWRTPIEIDPFTVPVEDKVGLLLAANEAALKIAGAKFVTSNMFFLKDEKTYANSEGALVEPVELAEHEALALRVVEEGDVDDADARRVGLALDPAVGVERARLVGDQHAVEAPDRHAAGGVQQERLGAVQEADLGHAALQVERAAGPRRVRRHVDPGDRA